VADPPLDPATLELLDRSIEADMLTPRRDGSMSRRPIWVVVVGGEAYVRSYRGEQGAWYRRVRRDGRAALAMDGETLEVTLEPEHGEGVNERVSDAFRAKYSARSPGPTKTMVNAEVSRTTLRLGPAA
jgi:hypothetical protein